MKKTLLFLFKTILSFVVFLALIIGGFSLWGYYTYNKSIDFTEIRELENKYVEADVINNLNNTDNKFDFIINNFTKHTNHDTKLILSWLLNREKNGEVPYYYLVSMSFAKLKMKDEAINYFELARLTSRIDNIRCNDASSSGAYSALESIYFSSMVELLKKNNNLLSAAKSWAYTYEEKVKDRKPAKWICMHGMKAFSGNQSYLPDDDWQKQRSKLRVKYFSENIKSLTSN